MPKRSRAELIEKLQNQFGFLRSSAAAFDAGNEAEAQRLATSIRVLVHTTETSHALLKQLGVQHQLRFLDTWVPPEPSRPGNVIVHRWDAGLAVIAIGDGTARYKAPLRKFGDRIRGPQPFRIWWNQWILQDQTGERFTRKQLVLFLANKEGGAHVDPEIKAKWVALSRLNSVGAGYGDDYIAFPAGPQDKQMGNPIPANVRQIAWEVDQTITEQLGHLLGADAPA